MRLLHSFDEEKDATRFLDVLFAEDIASSVRDGGSGAFGLWINDDDDLEPAKQILVVYLRSPRDPRFGTLEKEAVSKRKQHQKAEKKSRHQVKRAKDAFSPKGLGPMTMGVIGVCAFMALMTMTRFGTPAAGRHFQFVNIDLWWQLSFSRGYGPGAILPFDLKTSIAMATWQQGEVWRLLSPIFVHGDFFHLIFNLWWWKDLAGSLERMHSTAWLFAFVLVVGTLSNFAEYYFGYGPGFLGLSGVVYGVFGYFWARGHNDPNYPDRLPRMTVIWMVGWYVFCWAGFMDIANWAHTGGLALGGLWGILSSGVIRRRWLRKRMSPSSSSSPAEDDDRSSR